MEPLYGETCHIFPDQLSLILYYRMNFDQVKTDLINEIVLSFNYNIQYHKLCLVLYGPTFVQVN